MKIHRSFSDYAVNKPVITVGAFDGVHLGHLEIINQLKQLAQVQGGETVIVTFWPHPRHVLQGTHELKLLNTISEKEELIRKAGVDHLVILPFTSDFSRLSSSEFINEFLVEKLKVHQLLVGYNHHFGRDREGNFNVLKEYAQKSEFQINQVAPLSVDHEKVSSTKIRHALAEGNVSQANRFLGYRYMISGEVVLGNRLGNTIGFPTANIHLSEDYKLIPKDGVYAVTVRVSSASYKGMLNIGHRPTVNSNIKAKTLEVHLLEFEGDLYNKQISVEFVERIREEVKFPDITELQKQLNRDKSRVLEILSKN